MAVLSKSKTKKLLGSKRFSVIKSRIRVINLNFSKTLCDVYFKTWNIFKSANMSDTISEHSYIFGFIFLFIWITSTLILSPKILPFRSPSPIRSQTLEAGIVGTQVNYSGTKNSIYNLTKTAILCNEHIKLRTFNNIRNTTVNFVVEFFGDLEKSLTASV